MIFFDLCSGCNCDKICYVLALRVAILGLTPKLQRIPGLLSVGTKAFAVSLRRRQGQRLSPIGVNNQPESHEKSRFHPSLDPPKSPLRRGVGVDFEKIPVPPFLRGARGDLSLIVKQQSLTEFNVKLTLLGLLECPYWGVLDKRGICCK